MKRLILCVGALTILAVALGYIAQSGLAQDDKIPRRPDTPMDKATFYDRYVAPKFGLSYLAKPFSFQDRKRSVLNVGKLVVRHNNAGTWGYDRWGLNHQWPAGGKLTYYWTLGPMIGAKKRLPNGQLGITMATGVRGTVRDHEEEFQPLPGYDGGSELQPATIGIAYSDQPETWPSQWRIERDPTGAYRDAVTGKSFPGIERPLDRDQPGGRGLRFPGAFNGKVVADREAYMVMTDNDPKDGNIGQFNKGVGPLDIRIDSWAMQWSDVINEDFIVWRHIFTNAGPDTLFDVYVGMHGDPDTPEQGAFEWTDDFAFFVPQGDATRDPLLWNTVVVWDGDDKAEGFIANKVPWMSIKVLETPNDPKTGKPKGLTTMYLFLYSEDAQSDEQAYNQQMASGIETPDNVQPHPGDYTQTPNSYGPDITFVFASGPFTLPPGASLPFTIADIMGANKQDVLSNSALAQVLFNNDYRAAEPPKEPRVRAVAGDKKVTLYWDPNPSETGMDRLTGNNRFQGYRIYRSTDRGQSWGAPITDVFGTTIGYVPMAQFDLIDGVTGIDPLAPELILGDDTGLLHTLVDRNVVNGIEYWYAVCAYDGKDELGPITIRPLENPRRNNPYLDGDNTVAVVPKPNVAGLVTATVANIKHAAGASDGSVNIEILDPSLVTGHTYKVAFDNSATPTTVTVVDVDAGNKTIISGEPVSAAADVTQDQIPSFDGLRLIATDAETGVKKVEQAASSQAQIDEDYWADFWGGYFWDVAITINDYEIRFTAKGSTGYNVRGANPPVAVPFEVWDVTNKRQVHCGVRDRNSNGVWDSKVSGNTEYLVIVDTPYSEPFDTSQESWTLVFSFTPTSEPKTGEVFKLITSKIFSKLDVYEIKTNKSQIDNEKLNKELSKINVVPNPYVVSSVFETSLISKELQFRRLPPECTIRIYNLAGDLVRVLEHDNGTALEPWNLRTYNDQEVAFGVYIFHITTPTGSETMGKFAIIK
jgi:hypothetical protein